MNTGRLRLLHLREATEAKGKQMDAERASFQAIRNGEPTRAVSAFNLFHTPEPLAQRMAHALAELVSPESRILEPSAGLGRLYRAVRAAGLAGPMVMVENATQCCAELYLATEHDRSARLIQADFLSCDADRLGGRFDAVIMNPPFKQGRDIKHTRHALSLLNPGGVLVGLCYNGTRQRAKLMPESDQWYELPPETFRAEGTMAETAMMIWRT